MKVRLPKHREFLIKFADGYEKEDEAWQALNQIVADYSKDGKSVYTPILISWQKTKKRVSLSFAICFLIYLPTTWKRLRLPYAMTRLTVWKIG